MKPLFLIGVAACLFASGCDSKNPLSDPQKSKVDERLAGVWRERSDDGDKLLMLGINEDAKKKAIADGRIKGTVDDNSAKFTDTTENLARFVEDAGDGFWNAKAPMRLERVDAGGSGDQIDWNRAQQLHQKFVRGEKLTDEEHAYHDRAAKALQAKSKPENQSPPAKPPVGLKPLCDMTAQDHYRGEDGGLYGNGKNEPPEKHLQAARQQAKAIQPLDVEGKPERNGKIGLISIGMSNTTQEFSVFVRLANADPAKSSKVVVVDGAQGGMDSQAWAQPGILNRPDPWKALDQRLQQAGLSPKQVQVAWIKQARIAPGSIGEFPKHAEEMKGDMVAIIQKARERFPNLRIAYLSSRIYAGYAKTPLNPEPYAYESAFVVRWLIQDQIKGQSANSPLLLWGPYLWADGEKGRKADDLIWKPEDLGPDGTHPSDSGRRKVADLLLRFMKTDPTAKVWFAKGE
jgi:hypothetical protein